MNDLLNALGFGAGLGLYAMLLAMVVRDRRRGGRFDSVPLATAILGIVWNICSLSTSVLQSVGAAAAGIRVVSVCGVIALGLLPAVVVQSVVRGRRDQQRSGITVALPIGAYAASLGAAFLQLRALVEGDPVPSVLGLQLLTGSFVVLAVPLVVVTRRQAGGRRALWVAALAAFAVSALHLSQFHEAGTPWSTELLGHHASLPLALAILYQDYPFALADLFLKRALLLVLLVGTAVLGLSLGTLVPAGSAPQLALLAGGWVVTALAYPWMQRAVNWFVDSVVLARPHYRSLEASVVRDLQNEQNVDALLNNVTRQIGEALSAKNAEWTETDRVLDAHAPLVDVLDGPGVEISIPTSELPVYTITCSRLTGGRRVLSGDVQFLSNVANAAGRRIDALRLSQERYDRAVREQETAKLASQAELTALRAQLNPHFLFNALTTIGYLIQSAPPRALDTLMRLTALLRGVLRSEGEFTTLGRELDLVQAYLDIEHARFESRLRVRIEVPDHLRELPVPPLILQPLVENAVKHGIAPLRHGGEIVVSAAYHEHPSRLVLRVSDTGPGMSAAELSARRHRGVGLTNVERRLQCLYGDASSIAFDSTTGSGTVVELTLPSHAPVVVGARRIS